MNFIYTYIYMYRLFTSQVVHIGKNCTHGLGPRAVLKTEGTVFPNTDQPRLVNNIFIFFQQHNERCAKDPNI